MTTHTATELTTPLDLLAAVPFMVGYHPKDSLVAIALREKKVVMAMRVDFPEAEAMVSTSTTIAAHLLRESATESIVVGYLPSNAFEGDPLATLRDVIAGHGVIAVSYTHLTLPTIYSV